MSHSLENHTKNMDDDFVGDVDLLLIFPKIEISFTLLNYRTKY